MPWDKQNGSGGGNPWGSGGGSGKGGSGKGGSGKGGGGGSGQGPNLDAWMKELQEKLRKILPGGGSRLILILLGLLVIWGLSGVYRVGADEQGVVLRFGKFHTQTSPGLNYHLPFPIETVQTPKVTLVNRVDIGMRGATDEGRSSRLTIRDVPEESLMLTGDENIVDVDFSVFWLIKDAADFLFNIQNPTGTVKAVAESTMREVIGENDIQPILTEQRQSTEDRVRELMQKTLDAYGSGITVTQVKMQKVDPPKDVIDSFRDVQAARADQERARNEANAYANRVVPEAQGEAERIRREAEAYREQTVSESEGQASRFAAIYNEYREASEVTRQRLFLETLEKVMQKSDKVIIEQPEAGAQGVIPYLPLDQLRKKGTN